MIPNGANGGGSNVPGWLVMPALMLFAGLCSLAVAAEPPSRNLPGQEPALIDAVAMPLGPGQDSWLVMGSEFVGTRSTFIPLRTGFGAELACTIGSPTSIARAKLPLPDGVVLEALDLWRYIGPTLPTLGIKIQQHCLASDAADGNDPSTLASFFYSTGAAGYDASTLTTTAHSVDALHCSYYLEVEFDVGGASGCHGLDLRLLGARVVWRSE